jgi:hypothetical protein
MAPIPPIPASTVGMIYAAYEAAREDHRRGHLGASLIGGECDRALWLSFRWASTPQFDGRMLRLFQTGHMAEARFIADLRRIGVTVHESDPETGRQISVSAAGGHFSGSLDGAAIGIPEAPKTWHALEFKTHNMKSFTKLKADGVRKAKPQHWAQMQVYMHLTGMTRALYLAVCKDTDELYGERVEHDEAEALKLVAKGQRIVQAARPPERISADPAWFLCRYCDHRATCQAKALPDVSCRTCAWSTPVDDGTWVCDRHEKILSIGDQKAACGDHRYIPDLVAGVQVDAGEGGEWISYAMHDGTTWTDGRDEKPEPTP